MTSPRSLAVVDATIVTMRPLARERSNAQVQDADLGVIERGTLLASGGRIVAVGRSVNVPADAQVVDARGRVLMPGLVDAHTHALFAGDRIADFEAIAQQRRPSQGIAYTVEQTRKCSRERLVAVGSDRLSLMLAHGTTTAEVKTGYALTADGEAELLHAMHALDASPGLPHVIPTFCGAHALPPEFRDYDAFVDELCDRILPRVAATRIARFADAFCERGYFTPEQSERFLRACAHAGMALRIHADELAPSGGAAVAARLRCASADHLNYVDSAGIEGLAAAGCTAVLCPATTEYLGLDRRPPARELIAAGVPVALATDFNPGTSPCPSLQVVAHLARRRLAMTVAEVVAGVTVQAARSLGSSAGILEEGRPADLVLLHTTDIREFGYYYGANLVAGGCVAKPGSSLWF